MRNVQEMYTRFSGSKLKALTATAATIAALTSLAGCGNKYPKFEKNMDLNSFLAERYKNNEVSRCIGAATLRYGGHVRTAPYIETAVGPTIGGNLETEITEYTGLAATNSVLLTNPHVVKLSTIGDVDPNWYIEVLPNGEYGFINEGALAFKSLRCNRLASMDQQPGELMVK